MERAEVQTKKDTSEKPPARPGDAKIGWGLAKRESMLERRARPGGDASAAPA